MVQAKVIILGLFSVIIAHFIVMAYWYLANKEFPPYYIAFVVDIGVILLVALSSIFSSD
jgi:hypothetical protein